MAMQVFTDRNKAVQTIEYAHAAVHTDTLVIANENVTGVDTGAGRNYYIVAPDNKELHIVVLVTASNAAWVTLYKDPEVSAAGTAITHLRPNLYSERNVLTTYHTPTVSDIGTQIFQTRIPGNASNNFAQRVGGSTRNGQEIVLPAGRELIVGIAPEVDDTTVSLAVEYYEVPAGANKP